MTVLDYLDGVNERLELQDELDRLREKYGELREDYTIAEDRIVELENLTTGLARNAAWMSMELEKYQWISVKDRLPDANTRQEFIVYDADEHIVRSSVWQYGHWVDGNYYWIDGRVTHWMPLPQKPEKPYQEWDRIKKEREQ